MTVPQTMTVIEVPQAGGPEAMTLGTRPVPKPAPGEVLIEVAAAGVNRPDIVICHCGNSVICWLSDVFRLIMMSLIFMSAK